MLRRSLALNGYTYKEVDGKMQQVGSDESVRDFLKTLAADTTSPREVADKMIAAWNDKTGELQKSLNAARVEAVGNFIASESTFRSAFFSTVTLAPDEEFFYTNETLNETRISVMGEDGSPEQVRILKPQDRTSVGIYAVTSDKVRYKTLDIYKGDVRQTALKTIDIARDMRFKLDRIFLTALTASQANGGAFGAFSYETTNQGSKSKASRVYLAHSSIDTSHLPTTNDVSNGSGTGGTSGADGRTTVRYYDPVSSSLSGLRPAVCLAVMDYSDRWADVLPGGGRLMASGEIIVPSSDIINIVRGMTLSNNVQESIIQKEVQEQGYTQLTVAGKKWTFISDVTIPSGVCYPRFNLLPGIALEKPSWDKEVVTTNEMENWEERQQRKAYGVTIPAQYRPRAMRITYS